MDRGSFSVECILTLFAFKVMDPSCLHMGRGNHETLNMNKMYGFLGEVQAKFSNQVFDVFSEVFNLLPLGCVIGDRVLCVHGGLFSKDGVTLDDVRRLDRRREPPDEGLMCEMLWSDPHPMPGRHPSKRGVGVAFGPDVTARFLDENNLKMLVRSHEVKDEGYEVEAGGRLVTVFSAPNYCDQMGNKGAVITFDTECEPTYTTFTAVPHPPIPPMHYVDRNIMNMMR